MTSLDTVPQEVLEHIAFFAAAEKVTGPPSNIVPLLATCRRIHSQLSITSNHHLYARIFAHKFDIQPALERLGSDPLTPAEISAELKQRFIYLKRIRNKLDCKRSTMCKDALHQILFHVYLWMLENEEKNERQLREYADLDGWLREYWFSCEGASRALYLIDNNSWPFNDRNAALAMWLFWFTLKTERYDPNDAASYVALDVLRLFALAAHKYHLTNPSWTNFLPVSRHETPTLVSHFGRTLELSTLPVAIPAILIFLKLVNQLSSPITISRIPRVRRPMTCAKPSLEWECEWERCNALALSRYDDTLSKAFRPGSIEGVWEGQFTYTEFTAYAQLLAGAPPKVLQKSMVARHSQTWKLREYHLLTSDTRSTDSGIGFDLDNNVGPLPGGDPLRSYFPTGTQIREDREGLDIHVPGQIERLRYQRASVNSLQHDGTPKKANSCVIDVIIAGEGHSSWGQFNLVGRVRPCDGFISLSKEYADDDRGKWLYRGYLIGNVDGNIVGRWRDTLSPPEVPGYEGCFSLSRRR